MSILFLAWERLEKVISLLLALGGYWIIVCWLFCITPDCLLVLLLLVVRCFRLLPDYGGLVAPPLTRGLGSYWLLKTRSVTGVLM